MQPTYVAMQDLGAHATVGLQQQPPANQSSLPQQLLITDIEAPPHPSEDYGMEIDDEDDGCLLDSFTLATGFCALGMTNMQHRFFECGQYLRGKYLEMRFIREAEAFC